MIIDRRPHRRDLDIGLEDVAQSKNRRHETIRKQWAQLGDSRRTWTPFLVVPYKSVNPLLPGVTPDRGQVRPIPSGDVFWASPYILVENRGGLGLTAIAGEDNFVHARVFNFGKATSAPTQVDFYWADPSLGLGPGSFHHIGTEWVEIRHGTSCNVRCSTPWIPVLLNGGHECLMVNTSSPTMAAAPGSVFGPFDPIGVPFAPVLDRHVGQRNLTVVPAPSGAMRLSLALTNVMPFAVQMSITLRAAMFEVDEEFLAKAGQTEVVTWAAALAGDVEIPRNSPVRELDRRPVVKVSVGEVTGRITTEGSRTFAAKLIEHVGKGLGRFSNETIARVEMKAGERRDVDVVVDAIDAKAGQFAVVTLGQWWEDQPLGGYTLVGAVE